MTPEEAIEFLKGMQNKKIDYAEMVCAPAFAYGYEYVYPEPEDYAIEEAVKAFKEIQQYRENGTVEKKTQKKAVSIIEKWSDEHPVKTRQSDFLKMCPYCGSNNLEIFTIERNDSSKYKWKAYVICSECFGSAVNHGLDLTENEAKDNAIKAWNRRAGKQNEKS